MRIPGYVHSRPEEYSLSQKAGRVKLQM